MTNMYFIGLKEVVKAAQTVRQAFTQEVDITFITNVEYMKQEKVFSNVIVWNESQLGAHSLHSRAKILSMCSSPYLRTLYLDTDIYMLQVSF